MENTGEKLKAMAEDLHERLIGLERIDAVDEINVYCDNLEAEMTVAYESAFKHLQRLQETTFIRISEYRNSLIEAQHQRAASFKGAPRLSFTEEMAKLFDFKEKIPRLCEQERSKMASILTSDIKMARELEGDVRKRIMCNQFLRFKPNRFFDLLDDHVGFFEFLEDISSDCGKVQIHEESHIVDENCEYIMQLAFMPNDRLVFCTLERGLFIYRASDLSLLERVPDQAVTFSLLPGERLVVGRKDGELRIYDVGRPHSGDDEERDFVALDSNESGIRGKIFSTLLLPNGNLATCDSRGCIEIWDLNRAGTDKALVFCLDENFPCNLGVLSNGFLVSCTIREDALGSLKLWDPKKTQPLRTAETSLIAVMTLLVLPDDRVALGSEYGCISIYDPIEMEQVWKFQFDANIEVSALAYLPNGCLVAGDNKNRVHVWDLTTGKQVQTLDTGIQNLLTTIHVSADGKKIAFSGYNNELKTARLEFVSST